MAYQRRDSYYRRAKSEGYRSRAAYKLIELNQRYRIIRRGDRVVDLGAWPGGWMQVAAESVGERGRVVGVDIEHITPLPDAWAVTICADLRDENVRTQIVAEARGPADVVLSDMAPKLSGVRDRDEARSIELADIALEMAARLLRPGGKLLLKIFDGRDTQELVARLRKTFNSVQSIRPQATRRGSSELYALACDFRRPERDGESGAQMPSAK